MGAILSLAWGLSFDLFYDHGIGAEIRTGSTGEGSTFLSLRNSGTSSWTNAKVVADDAFFVRVDRLGQGHSTDARLSEFANAYRIPRPLGVYMWEGIGSEPEPAFAAATYRPESVTVIADEGTYRTAVSF